MVDRMMHWSKLASGLASSSTMVSLIQVMHSCETALEGLFLKLEDALPGTANFKFYKSRIVENTQGTSLHKFDDVAIQMEIH